jgi:formylmethanofuran dehydrogenase subunit B
MAEEESHSIVERVVADVGCTQCGCVCDDLRLSVRENRIVSFEPGCLLAEQFLERVAESGNGAASSIRGVEAKRSDAISAAATMLKSARSPLIYGLSRSATAGQQAACRLADLIGANIDTTASTCHAPSILALQQAGESTSSLGEVRNRSDLVIYWGSNPVKSHPRHLERFVDAPGLQIPQGRAGRTVVVIDTQSTATSDLADVFIKIAENADFQLIHVLRALVQGKRVASHPVADVAFDDVQRLADLMVQCRYGAVFFGLGITHGALPHLTVDNLLRLVTDLNSRTRFVARRMRIPGDVTGADSVLCWQTGYPFSVNLNREYPRYNPGEFTANDLLEREEVDAAVLVGSEGVAKLSLKARQFLQTIPTIVLEYPSVNVPFEPTVLFRTAIYGIHRRGSVYRMDEVPLHLRSVVESELPTDDAVLNGVIDCLLADGT